MNAIYIGPAVLVESQTNTGVWYICEAGSCTCPAYIYRGACKHQSVAAWVDEMDREMARPVEAAIKHNRTLDTTEHHLALEADELARHRATGEWPAIWGRQS